MALGRLDARGAAIAWGVSGRGPRRRTHNQKYYSEYSGAPVLRRGTRGHHVPVALGRPARGSRRPRRGRRRADLRAHAVLHLSCVLAWRHADRVRRHRLGIDGLRRPDDGADRPRRWARVRDQRRKQRRVWSRAAARAPAGSRPPALCRPRGEQREADTGRAAPRPQLRPGRIQHSATNVTASRSGLWLRRAERASEKMDCFFAFSRTFFHDQIADFRDPRSSRSPRFSRPAGARFRFSWRSESGKLKIFGPPRKS